MTQPGSPGQVLGDISARLDALLESWHLPKLLEDMARAAAIGPCDGTQVVTVPVRLPTGLLGDVHHLAKAEYRTVSDQLVAMLEAYSPPLTGVEAAAERIIEAEERGARDDGHH